MYCPLQYAYSATACILSATVRVPSATVCVLSAAVCILSATVRVLSAAVRVLSATVCVLSATVCVLSATVRVLSAAVRVIVCYSMRTVCYSTTPHSFPVACNPNAGTHVKGLTNSSSYFRPCSCSSVRRRVSHTKFHIKKGSFVAFRAKIGAEMSS